MSNAWAQSECLSFAACFLQTDRWFHRFSLHLCFPISNLTTNLWLQAVTYVYPHLVICQRAPPYNSENAHKRHLFNYRRFEHSIQYRLSEPIHEKKN